MLGRKVELGKGDCIKRPRGYRCLLYSRERALYIVQEKAVFSYGDIIQPHTGLHRYSIAIHRFAQIYTAIPIWVWRKQLYLFWPRFISQLFSAPQVPLLLTILLSSSSPKYPSPIGYMTMQMPQDHNWQPITDGPPQLCQYHILSYLSLSIH